MTVHRVMSYAEGNESYFPHSRADRPTYQPVADLRVHCGHNRAQSIQPQLGGQREQRRAVCPSRNLNSYCLRVELLPDGTAAGPASAWEDSAPGSRLGLPALKTEILS